MLRLVELYPRGGGKTETVWFHGFGLSPRKVCNNDICAPWTAAIVEHEDGSVRFIEIKHLRFLEPLGTPSGEY